MRAHAGSYSTWCPSWAQFLFSRAAALPVCSEAIVMHGVVPRLVQGLASLSWTRWHCCWPSPLAIAHALTCRSSSRLMVSQVYNWIRAGLMLLQGFLARSCFMFGAQIGLNCHCLHTAVPIWLAGFLLCLYIRRGGGCLLQAWEALNQLWPWGLMMLVNRVMLNNDNNPLGFTVKTGLKLSVFLARKGTEVTNAEWWVEISQRLCYPRDFGCVFSLTVSELRDVTYLFTSNVTSL